MNRTTELLKEIKDYPEDDVIKAELKGRLDREKEILEIIDNFEIELKNRKKKTKDKLFKKVLESKREAIKELKQQLTNSEGENV